jgi:hypothetical protein
MDRISKTFALFLILVIVMSCTVKSTNAQTIPKPSVPEFTVKYMDNSYDVPPKYGIDQYTGQNITIQTGYHIDNRSVEFTIKNQMFSPYNDSNGNSIKLFYDFRWKGSYGDVWTYYPLDSNGRSVFHYGTFYNPEYPTRYVASNSDYTVLNLDSSLLGSGYEQRPPDGVQVNFQVQALIGYFDFTENGYFILIGQSSDWSNTQIVTIGETASTSPTPNLSSSPAVPELSWLTILPILLAIPIVLFIVRKTVCRKSDAKRAQVSDIT